MKNDFNERVRKSQKKFYQFLVLEGMKINRENNKNNEVRTAPLRMLAQYTLSRSFSCTIRPEYLFMLDDFITWRKAIYRIGIVLKSIEVISEESYTAVLSEILRTVIIPL